MPPPLLDQTQIAVNTWISAAPISMRSISRVSGVAYQRIVDGRAFKRWEIEAIAATLEPLRPFPVEKRLRDETERCRQLVHDMNLMIASKTSEPTAANWTWAGRLAEAESQLSEVERVLLPLGEMWAGIGNDEDLADSRERTCERCSYQWATRVDEPSRCPRCKSAYWNGKPPSTRQVSCAHCGAKWEPRVDAPRKCPRCQRYDWDASVAGE